MWFIGVWLLQNGTETKENENYKKHKMHNPMH